MSKNSALHNGTMAGWFLQRMKKEFLESRTVNVNAITIGGLINHFQFSGRWLDGIENSVPLRFDPRSRPSFPVKMNMLAAR